MALHATSFVKMISQVFLLGLLSSMASAIQSSSSTPSQETKTYIVHMDANKMATLESSLAGSKKWHESVLDSILELSAQGEKGEKGEVSSSSQLLYVYNTVLSGFSAKLTPKQASSLEKIDGFLHSFPDVLLNLHTTHTPQFLGLKSGAGLWSQSNMASDVIIGIIDSGIWPEHESFQDNHHFPPIPKKWKGKCEAGTNFSSNSCNRKLIGATAFWKGYEASGGFINETTEYKSVRDSEGHGTHTASTAAGNGITSAGLFGNAKGSMTGMRYTSRVASYKACWSTGCASSDIIAAVDRAVRDGVNVLSLSLGGGPLDYYADSIAIATFGAVRKGVFVSCSGGNSGPSAFTVSNAAPWITTVAASYIDRSFPTLVTLGDGRSYKGASLYVGKPTKQLPLVYGSKAGEDAEYCQSGTLTRKLVEGKMVLCERGFIDRAEKGENVKLNGGLGMLLLNSEEDGEELLADAHVLPGSSLGATASAAIKKYISSSKNPTAMIKFLGTVYGDPAPISAAFSSRGPNIISPDIIKPDVTAPGMNILAAWPPSLSPTLLASDKRQVSFNIMSGTSMSCPHVSGLSALLKSRHPDWSPAAIKSALMTTASTVNNRNSSIIDISSGSPATPFAFGSGHVDPEKASNPGLVYDITPNNYLEYLCSMNYTSKQMSAFAGRKFRCSKRSVRPATDLNYPSFSVLLSSDKPNSVLTHTRIVSNVGPTRCKYTVQVRQPKKVTVNVVPKVLDFSKTGQKLSYKVTFAGNGPKGQSGYSFGHLIWTCSELFAVRSPIAVAWQ